MTDRNSTICAVATPPGRGGIGVIRISGPGALSITKEITGLNPEPRRAIYCKFRDQNHDVIDDGILLYFKAPASFTGEDVIEMQLHGGRIVLNILQNRINELGAVLARPGEFTERAFLNNKLDLVQAEAVADLIDSVSVQAARCATRSLQGEFSESISALLDELVNLRVYVEGALDFPDEEIDFLEDGRIRERINKNLEEVGGMVDRARCGRILNEGIQAVIIGRPNVGKSSLLNRLSRSDRAIVNERPGTTRDVIEDRILIRGISVAVSDTAGIRETEDSIELEGIRRAVSETEKSDIVLLVLEYNDSEEDFSYLEKKLKSSGKILVVRNKIDLVPEKPKVVQDRYGIPQVYLSAKTGEGIELLEDLVLQSVLEDASEETAILARERHIEALSAVRKHLQAALENADRGTSPELIAAELTGAQNALARITGEFVADDLLAEIFSRFCIGK